MSVANTDSFLISTEGGKPRRITHDPAHEATPCWSSDGKSFYFRSNVSGQDEMWKMRTDGGEAIQITRGGAVTGFESADGRWLYYVNDSQLWRAPSGGGEGVLIASGFQSHKWRLAKRGAYYSPSSIEADEGASQIRYFDFATRESRLVAEVDGIVGIGMMAISPDGSSLLFAKGEPEESDLMLVEGFE